MFIEIWRKWCRFRKRFQAKGSSVAHLPYYIVYTYNAVGWPMASTYIRPRQYICLESDILTIVLLTVLDIVHNIYYNLTMYVRSIIMLYYNTVYAYML